MIWTKRVRLPYLQYYTRAPPEGNRRRLAMYIDRGCLSLSLHAAHYAKISSLGCTTRCGAGLVVVLSNKPDKEFWVAGFP
jgi:hypothetical protein